MYPFQNSPPSPVFPDRRPGGGGGGKEDAWFEDWDAPPVFIKPLPLHLRPPLTFDPSLPDARGEAVCQSDAA